MMKKRYYLLILFLSIFQTSYSQHDSLLYKESIVVNLNDLFIKRLFVTYSKSINSKNYLELSFGFRYSDKKTVDAGSFLYFKDAFWYYNALTFRIGIKKYNHKNLFWGISSNLNYQFFDKVRFNRYEDWEGELADRDAIISRTKSQIGGLIKGGIAKRRGKKFVIETYFGFGVLFSHDKETISYVNSNSTPINSNKNHFVPTIHLGISIGLTR